jgi:hypothetical protein
MRVSSRGQELVARAFAKYLPFVTVLVTVALGAMLKLRSATQDRDLLWAIWAVLSLLAVSEFFKRTQTLDRFAEQLDDLHRSVSPAIDSLKGREELYDRCAELIRNSRESVVDTTGGADPTPPTQREARARDKYRQACKEAVERGTRYREIFTVPSAERLEHLKAALKEKAALQEAPRIRVLRGLQPHVPLLDFVVIDSEAVLFSRPDVDVAGRGSTLFALVRDPTIGNMFGQFFQECWNSARAVTLRGDSVVFDDTGQRVEPEVV